MPDDFSRLDFSEREDVDHVFELIRQHAMRRVQEELKKDEQLDGDANALKMIGKSVRDCIASAQVRLEPNLSVNGMSYAEGASQTQPFDQELSRRVQRLTEQADDLTAEVITARKNLPARRAAALEARLKIIDRRREILESKRRRVEEAFEKRDADARGLNLDRAEQIGETLEAAVQDIEKLKVLLLEQASAAQEQARFVKRLRIMSASYK